MTRSQEEFVFCAFKELYHDFPVGEYIRGEQPDFVIHTVNKLIGVEITQVFIDNYLNPRFNKKRKESLHKKFGDNLCEKLIPIIPFNFVLSIDFGVRDFSTNEIDIIITDCGKYFRYAQFPDDLIKLNIENIGQLPQEIESVELFKFPHLKKSFYSESAVGVMPDLTLKHLSTILEKKGKALKKYRLTKKSKRHLTIFDYEKRHSSQGIQTGCF